MKTAWLAEFRLHELLSDPETAGFVEPELLSQSSPISAEHAYDAPYLESYWWRLGAEEREHYLPVRLPDAFLTRYSADCLTPASYIPAELGLTLAYYWFKDLGHVYIPVRQSSRLAGLIPSEVSLNELLHDLLFDAPSLGRSGILDGIEAYKVGKNQFKSKALWYLDLVEKGDGISDFTRYARKVLTLGRRDFRVYAWLAHQLVKSEAESKLFRLPSKPLDLAPSKTRDIPGLWQIRKLRRQHGFYASKISIICANEHGRGVLLSITPELMREHDLQTGDMVDLRARVVGPDKSGKYLKLDYVKIKKRPEPLAAAA